MPALRSAVRWLFAAAGVALVAAGLLLGSSALGAEGFPTGLALGFAVLLFAAGGALLGGAALVSGRGLRSGQRAALKFAGALAVAAFVLPAFGVFVAPGLLVEWFGMRGIVAALVGWLYLTAAAVVVALAVAVWRAAELAYARVTG